MSRIVFLLLAVCYYYERKRKTVESFVLDVSRESLLVYTAHLLVIYGTFWNDRSLAELFGHSFSVTSSIIATAGLTVCMVLMAKGWGWLKQNAFRTSRYLAYASGVIVIVLFLIRG